jgi:hypothetical protein
MTGIEREAAKEAVHKLVDAVSNRASVETNGPRLHRNFGGCADQKLTWALQALGRR